jgi:hypothetical protein
MEKTDKSEADIEGLIIHETDLQIMDIIGEGIILII